MRVGRLRADGLACYLLGQACAGWALQAPPLQAEEKRLLSPSSTHTWEGSSFEFLDF